MLTWISADIMCEVIYIFVDIGGIVDDHCIKLIFISRCPVNIGPRGRDRLVVGFMTPYALSAYHH